MRILIPEGAEFVPEPQHLDPLRRLGELVGELVIVPGTPRDKADLIARVKDTDVVILDYSLMDAEVLAACPRLRLIAFLGLGYARRIVDNAALLDLLRAGRIAGAAFDVFDEEPLPPDEPWRDLPTVLVTPHIGYNTREASLNMLNIAIATVEAHLHGERLHVVNPEAADAANRPPAELDGPKSLR